MRDLVGRAVVLGGIAALLAREVDAHHQQALGLQARRGARHLQAGRGVDLGRGGHGHGLEEAAVAGGELGSEEAQRAQDHARREGGLGAGSDLGPPVEGLLRPPDPAVDRPHHVGDLEPRPDVELGREADLEVAHAFGLRVLAQLEGHALEGLLVLEHGHRVAEALEVLGQVAVALAEDLRRRPSSVSVGRATFRLRARSMRVARRRDPSRWTWRSVLGRRRMRSGVSMGRLSAASRSSRSGGQASMTTRCSGRAPRTAESGIERSKVARRPWCPLARPSR